MEVWKEIKGYEGRYEISNIGRVKSLPKNYRFPNERIRIPSVRSGYHILGLRSADMKYTTVSVHRLVAEAFIPNPENKPQVNHINGIKTDNRVENLEWNTSQENIKHAFKNHLRVAMAGERNGNTKLTQQQVNEIRSKHQLWVYTHKMLAEEYGVSSSAIAAICSGRYWVRSNSNCTKADLRGSKHPLSKLKEEQVMDIKLSSDNPSVLSRRYGVSRQMILNIQGGIAWKHVKVLLTFQPKTI